MGTAVGTGPAPAAARRNSFARGILFERSSLHVVDRLGDRDSTTEAEPSIFHAIYRVDEKLSQGKFSQVRTATSRDGRRSVTVLILDVRSPEEHSAPQRHADRPSRTSTRKMLEVWKEIGKSKHCVSLVEAYVEQDDIFYLVTKRHTALTDALAAVKYMRRKEACLLFTSMLSGIRHLHKKSIVHRDVRIDSFFYGGPDKTTLKLGDFGSAAFLPECGLMQGVRGTGPYMSPEMASDSQYGLATDMWSFGIAAYLIIHGDFPRKAPKGNTNHLKLSSVHDEPRIQVFYGPTYGGAFTQDFVGEAAPWLQSVLERSMGARATVTETQKHDFLNPDATCGECPVFKVGCSRSPLESACAMAREATEEMDPLSPELARPATQTRTQTMLDEVVDHWQCRCSSTKDATSKWPRASVENTKGYADTMCTLGSRSSSLPSLRRPGAPRPTAAGIFKHPHARRTNIWQIARRIDPAHSPQW